MQQNCKEVKECQEKCKCVCQEESFPQKLPHRTPWLSSPVGCHLSWLFSIPRTLALFRNGVFFRGVSSENSKVPSDSSPQPSTLRKDGGPWRVLAVSCQSEDHPRYLAPSGPTQFPFFQVQRRCC